MSCLPDGYTFNGRPVGSPRGYGCAEKFVTWIANIFDSARFHLIISHFSSQPHRSMNGHIKNRGSPQPNFGRRILKECIGPNAFPYLVIRRWGINLSCGVVFNQQFQFVASTSRGTGSCLRRQLRCSIHQRFVSDSRTPHFQSNANCRVCSRANRRNHRFDGIRRELFKGVSRQFRD